VSQLDLFKQGPETPAEKALTERQAFAEQVIRERGPVTSEELGAHVHAWRRDRGGRGHGPDERCHYCPGEGASVGRILARKGLVTRRRGVGWVVVGWAPDTGPSAMLADDEALPF